jgi:hypothetical protein
MYDREPNFEEHFTEGDRFVITGMNYVGSINTKFGPAEKTLITIVTLDSYPEKTTYSAIGAGFANLARRSERGDFPHVAQFMRVDLGEGKTLKTFSPVMIEPRAFVEGDDGPPLPESDPLHAPGAAAPDDIPF